MIHYLQLFRLPGIFTAASNIIAAHFIGNRGSIEWGALSVLVVASIFLYVAGMTLNDCFDFEEDCRERPTRPLPAGHVPLKNAWIIGWTLLVLGVLLASSLGVVPFLIALCLAGSIVAYNAWGKHTILGPLIMGGCRYLNWLLGLSITSISIHAAALLAIPIFFYITALTSLSSIETTGGDTKRVLLCAAGICLAGLSIVTLNTLGILHHHWALAVTLSGIAYLMFRLHQVFNEPSPKNIQNSVSMLLLAIIPLDAAMVLNGGSSWGALVVLLLLVPSKLTARRLYVT